jgi:hypothetical protein
MIQHIQINTCNTAHKQNQGQKKPHHHFKKAFHRVQYPFIIKVLKKLGIEVKCLNKIKAICDKPIATNILNREKLKLFPLQLGMRQDYSLSSLLLNIVLEFLGKRKK